MSGLTVEVGVWRLTWRGGRLGDVSHLEYPNHALAAVQVGAWDPERDTLEAEPDAGALRKRLAEWIADDGAAYLRELPYLV